MFFFFGLVICDLSWCAFLVLWRLSGGIISSKTKIWDFKWFFLCQAKLKTEAKIMSRMKNKVTKVYISHVSSYSWCISLEHISEEAITSHRGVWTERSIDRWDGVKIAKEKSHFSLVTYFYWNRKLSSRVVNWSKTSCSFLISYAIFFLGCISQGHQE